MAWPTPPRSDASRPSSTAASTPSARRRRPHDGPPSPRRKPQRRGARRSASSLTARRSRVGSGDATARCQLELSVAEYRPRGCKAAASGPRSRAVRRTRTATERRVSPAFRRTASPPSPTSQVLRPWSAAAAVRAWRHGRDCRRSRRVTECRAGTALGGRGGRYPPRARDGRDGLGLHRPAQRRTEPAVQPGLPRGRRTSSTNRIGTSRGGHGIGSHPGARVRRRAPSAPRGGQWCDLARRRREGCRRVRGTAARLREPPGAAPRHMPRRGGQDQCSRPSHAPHHRRRRWI